MENTNIGKKVFLLNERNYSWYIDKSQLFEIISIKEPQEVNDYCYHYLVKNGDEKIEEVRDYQCVFAPQENLQEVDMIQKYLSDNGADFDEIYQPNNGSIIISVSWGDWRHSHMFLRNLMEYLGYKQMAEILTEEDGSDCYSADHIYVHKDDEKLNTLKEMRQIFSN